MQEAISIYLGGEIITPDLCDYDSYKILGLKCPFCQCPVFYRAGDTYQLTDKITGEKTGKEITRKACFAHFKMDAETGQLCEARSLTPEGRKEIEDIQRRSRNQRLRLFERHLPDLLWSMQDVDWRFYCKNFGHEKASQKNKEYFSFVVKNFAKSNLAHFKALCNIGKTRVSEIMDFYTDSRETSNNEEIELANKLKANRAFCESVSNELLKYLSCRCSERQFYYLCIYFASQPTTSEERNKKSSLEIMLYDENFLTDSILYLVATNWRELFEAFEKKSKGFG